MCNIRTRYRAALAIPILANHQPSLRRRGYDFFVKRFVVLDHVAEGEALFEFAAAGGS